MNFVKGILIGIALVVPGLSGSIFAVVVGLYDKILKAVSEFRKNTKKNLLFLLPIVFGVIVGIVFSAKAVIFVCEKYTWQSVLFFIGLIGGCVPSVLKKTRVKKYWLNCVIAFALVVIVTMLSNNESQEFVAITNISSIMDAVTVFIAGFVSCSLMLIPGVSGSVVLIVIKQYGTIYNAMGSITDFGKALLAGNFNIESLKAVAILIPFGIGALVGVIIASRVITYVISKYSMGVYGAVLGFIFSSMFALVYSYSFPAFSFSAIGIGILCLVIGAACTFFMEK